MTETRQSITINSSSAVSGDGGNDDDDDYGDDRDGAIFHDQYICCFWIEFSSPHFSCGVKLDVVVKAFAQNWANLTLTFGKEQKFASTFFLPFCKLVW